MVASSRWWVQPSAQIPDWVVNLIQPYLPEQSGEYAAQLLWQRGLRQPEQIAKFIDPNQYQPTSPFAFGQEMQQALVRLQQAMQTEQKVAIWGDFDADGILATAVLWEGLRQFLPDQQLTYWIPNRFTESHGLSESGIAALARQGCQLIVTADIGSTNLAEIKFSHSLGIDLIVTDRCSVLAERPPVAAILNPKALPTEHPFANLSGVAVAYKLVEALYEIYPSLPQRPLADLLDLVAIGLMADLTVLTGDCRYLAQKGILCLQRNQEPINPPRPGIAKLLELCRRSGDRPTDISFGLGPRLNAISRIRGDAHLCVELLTSHDRERCQQLALETELANTRRKALQHQIEQQVKQKITELDLSTTEAIVLSDPQWSVNILGLVAEQIAQEYGRLTILLSADENQEIDGLFQMASGAACSVNQLDLYALLQQHSHLLHRFGGHSLAVELSVPIENIALLRQAINQQLRLREDKATKPQPQADLVVTVAELGKGLFQELKLLEPYGISNSVPKLLIQNCWFTQVWHKKIQDLQGRKLEYVKTEFIIRDASSEAGFPGVWWGHYKDELPPDRCDVLVELDFNSYANSKQQKRYEIRLIAVKPHESLAVAQPDLILDWRHCQPDQSLESVLLLIESPASWIELQDWVQQARQSERKLALAYGAPTERQANVVWQQLINLANALSQTGETMSQAQLQKTLQLGAQSLRAGLRACELSGYNVNNTEAGIRFLQQTAQAEPELKMTIAQFLQIVQEEQFMKQYFYSTSLKTLQATIEQLDLV